MKLLKFIAATLIASTGCLIALIIFAPAIAGLLLLHDGTTLATGALDLPKVVGWLLFLALVPACWLWSLQALSARARKWAAIVLISVPLARLVINHAQLLDPVVTRIEYTGKCFGTW